MNPYPLASLNHFTVPCSLTSKLLSTRLSTLSCSGWLAPGCLIYRRRIRGVREGVLRFREKQSGSSGRAAYVAPLLHTVQAGEHGIPDFIGLRSRRWPLSAPSESNGYRCIGLDIDGPLKGSHVFTLDAHDVFSGRQLDRAGRGFRVLFAIYVDRCRRKGSVATLRVPRISSNEKFTFNGSASTVNALR